MSVFRWLNNSEPESQLGMPGNAPSTEPLPRTETPQEMTLSETHAARSESDLQDLEERIIAALKTVYDPEIPVNIYDLGLIYGLNLEPQIAHVEIEMTLTAPGCPVAQTFPGEVERRVLEVPGVHSAHVELVWDPPWTRERMTEAAMLTLGML